MMDLWFQPLRFETDDGDWVDCPTCDGKNLKVRVKSIEEFLYRFEIPLEQHVYFFSRQLCGDAEAWIALHREAIGRWSWGQFIHALDAEFEEEEQWEFKEETKSLFNNVDNSRVSMESESFEEDEIQTVGIEIDEKLEFPQDAKEDSVANERCLHRLQVSDLVVQQCVDRGDEIKTSDSDSDKPLALKKIVIWEPSDKVELILETSLVVDLFNKHRLRTYVDIISNASQGRDTKMPSYTCFCQSQQPCDVMLDKGTIYCSALLQAKDESRYLKDMLSWKTFSPSYLYSAVMCYFVSDVAYPRDPNHGVNDILNFARWLGLTRNFSGLAVQGYEGSALVNCIQMSWVYKPANARHWWFFDPGIQTIQVLYPLLSLLLDSSLWRGGDNQVLLHFLIWEEYPKELIVAMGCVCFCQRASKCEFSRYSCVSPLTDSYHSDSSKCNATMKSSEVTMYGIYAVVAFAMEQTSSWKFTSGDRSSPSNYWVTSDDFFIVVATRLPILHFLLGLVEATFQVMRLSTSLLFLSILQSALSLMSLTTQSISRRFDIVNMVSSGSPDTSTGRMNIFVGLGDVRECWVWAAANWHDIQRVEFLEEFTRSRSLDLVIEAPGYRRAYSPDLLVKRNMVVVNVANRNHMLKLFILLSKHNTWFWIRHTYSGVLALQYTYIWNWLLVFLQFVSFGGTGNHCGFACFCDHGVGKLQWPDSHLATFHLQVTLYKSWSAFLKCNYFPMTNSGAAIPLKFLTVSGLWVASYIKKGLFFIGNPLVGISVKLLCLFWYVALLAFQVLLLCISVVESTTILNDSTRSTVAPHLKDTQAPIIFDITQNKAPYGCIVITISFQFGSKISITFRIPKFGGPILWHLAHPMLSCLPAKNRYSNGHVIHLQYLYLVYGEYGYRYARRAQIMLTVIVQFLWPYTAFWSKCKLVVALFAWCGNPDSLIVNWLNTLISLIPDSCWWNKLNTQAAVDGYISGYNALYGTKKWYSRWNNQSVPLHLLESTYFAQNKMYLFLAQLAFLLYRIISSPIAFGYCYILGLAERSSFEFQQCNASFYHSVLEQCLSNSTTMNNSSLSLQCIKCYDLGNALVSSVGMNGVVRSATDVVVCVTEPCHTDPVMVHFSFVVYYGTLWIFLWLIAWVVFICQPMQMDFKLLNIAFFTMARIQLAIVILHCLTYGVCAVAKHLYTGKSGQFEVVLDISAFKSFRSAYRVLRRFMHMSVVQVLSRPKPILEDKDAFKGKGMSYPLSGPSKAINKAAKAKQDQAQTRTLWTQVGKNLVAVKLGSICNKLVTVRACV